MSRAKEESLSGPDHEALLLKLNAALLANNKHFFL